MEEKVNIYIVKSSKRLRPICLALCCRYNFSDTCIKRSKNEKGGARCPYFVYDNSAEA